MTQAMQGLSSMTSTSAKRGSGNKLSQEGFKAGIKVLMAEYSWKPDEEQLRQWYRTLGWISDDAWMNAIDNWLLGDSEWRPKPGQLLKMAQQTTPREQAMKEQQKKEEAARKREEDRNAKPVTRNWPKILKDEEQMSHQVRRAILGHLGITPKTPGAIKIVMDTIHLMTMEQAMVLAYEDPIAEALPIAETLYNNQRETMDGEQSRFDQVDSIA